MASDDSERSDGSGESSERDDCKSRVARHEAEFVGIRARAHSLGSTLMVMQGQLGKMGEHIAALTTAVPPDLAIRLVRFELMLTHLTETLEAGYVKRTEWTELKTEHDQIKRLVYGTVAALLTAVVAALSAMVIRK